MGARTAAYARCSGRCGTSETIERSSAPRPCKSTTSGAPLSASAPPVTTTGGPKGAVIMEFLSGLEGGSGDDAEAAGPRDLLARGEGDLQEAEGLELTGAGERAGVDGPEATGGDGAGQLRLGVRVVTGEEHGRRVRADGAGRQRAGEGRVEGLDEARLGERLGDLGGGRAVGGDDERVEGLEVHRVGDVDDDLAGEALAALLDDRRDGAVGHGEHDDVAVDRGRGVALAQQLHRVAAPGEDAGDGLSHVSRADYADACHGALLRSIG